METQENTNQKLHHFFGSTETLGKLYGFILLILKTQFLKTSGS